MGLARYISEDEAINISGVSAKTLERFAEAGYLSIETEDDGLRLYSADELQSVFSPAETSKNESSQSVDDIPYRKKPQSEISTSKPVETKKEELSDESAQPTTNVNKDNVVQFTKEKKNTREVELEDEVDVVMEKATESIELAALGLIESNELNELKKKNYRLEKTLEVYEKIIQLREEQLEKSEKDCQWLRNLVDRLEEKAERSQIIHLSETQMLRNMIEHQQQLAQRSPVRATLEWLGIMDAKPMPALPTPLQQPDVVVSSNNN